MNGCMLTNKSKIRPLRHTLLFSHRIQVNAVKLISQVCDQRNNEESHLKAETNISNDFMERNQTLTLHRLTIAEDSTDQV